MDLQLEGRPILVAGASRGIGLAIVEACLAEGAKVALTARSAGPLELARARLATRYDPVNVCAFVGDLCDTTVIDEAVEYAEQRLGPLWGAVANVEIGAPTPGLEMTDEAWRAAFDQNTHSAYFLARAALRGMLERRGGSFLFISSIASIAEIGSPLNYAAAKSGVNMLAKGIAALVGPSGVRVNALAPGNVLFEGGNWEARLKAEGGERWQEWVEKEVSLQRFGRVEEIAAMAVFLLSPRSSFTHGTIVVVDGGQVK